jgi:hypothetical protein
MIWSLHITFPDADILLHADDIDTAFQRIEYLPEMAILFAYVFGAYLIIPVGHVFGSRVAPSFFFLKLDIHADLVTTGNLTSTHVIHPQAANIELPEPPEVGAFTPAIEDALNLPLSAGEQKHYQIAASVDDNGIAAIVNRIVDALQQSLVSAFTLFGWPDQDRQSTAVWQLTNGMLWLTMLCCSRLLHQQSNYDGYMATVQMCGSHLQYQDCSTIVTIYGPSKNCSIYHGKSALGWRNCFMGSVYFLQSHGSSQTCHSMLLVDKGQSMSLQASC